MISGMLARFEAVMFRDGDAGEKTIPGPETLLVSLDGEKTVYHTVEEVHNPAQVSSRV
jgi:hypothetical protein